MNDRRYTSAVYRRDRSERLFDQVGDPGQRRNLANDAAQPDALVRLRGQLTRRMASLQDTFEACTWYRGRWTVDRCVIRGAREAQPASRDQ